MSESTSFYAQGFDAFNFDTVKQSNMDFASFHSPGDIVAPDPELFEVDIDSRLQECEDLLQVFTGEPIYSIPRGSWGPPSTITSSGFSESTSDDIFSDVSSYYGPPSSTPQEVLNSIEMEFQRVRVASDYGGAIPQSISLDDSDPTSFGPMPPTPPRSPSISLTSGKLLEKGFPMRASYSDYGAPRRTSITSDYFNQLGFNTAPIQPTVSPLHISSQLPPAQPPPMSDDMKVDPRRKYKCSACPRAFARAYNLKTHMGTHDPNRLKPHVCPHRSCGRSFSRKHDLGRHLVSIHRDESIHSAKKAVGVGGGERTWCDSCGKGSVGGRNACNCHAVE